MKFLKAFWIHQLTKQQQQVITPVSFGKYLGRLFLVAALFTLPLFLTSFQEARSTVHDWQEAFTQTPNFTIKENTLNVAEKTKSSIYEANSFVFVFDPNEKISLSSVQDRLNGNQFGLGFRKHSWYFILPQDSSLSEILGMSEKQNSYATTLLADEQRSTFLALTNFNLGLTVLLALVLFFMLFIPQLIALLLTLLFAALLCNLLNRSRGLPFKFSHTFKVVLFLSPLPFLLTFILTCLRPEWQSFYFLAGIIALLYWQTIQTFILRHDNE